MRGQLLRKWMRTISWVIDTTSQSSPHGEQHLSIPLLPYHIYHTRARVTYLHSSTTHSPFPFYRRSGLRLLFGWTAGWKGVHVCTYVSYHFFGSLLPVYLTYLPTYLQHRQVGEEGGMNFTSLRFFACIIYVCMYLASASASILALCLEGTKQVRFYSTIYICRIASWQRHTQAQFYIHLRFSPTSQLRFSEVVSCAGPKVVSPRGCASCF